jgi:Rod binding domain-containing protein
MSNPVSGYYDFAGLSGLRANALSSDNQDAAIEKVGIEFESAFFKMILEEMQKAGEPLKSELSESGEMDQYQSMFNEEVAHSMAARQVLGISDWIRFQLIQQKQVQTDLSTSSVGS